MSTFSEDFADMLNLVVTVNSYQGEDSAGNETYGADTAVQVYAELEVARGGQKATQDQIGDPRISAGRIIAPPSSILPKDRITFTHPTFGEVVDYVDSVKTYFDPEDQSVHHVTITWKEDK